MSTCAASAAHAKRNAVATTAAPNTTTSTSGPSSAPTARRITAGSATATAVPILTPGLDLVVGNGSSGDQVTPGGDGNDLDQTSHGCRSKGSPIRRSTPGGRGSSPSMSTVRHGGYSPSPLA